ncbi:MAG: glycosyltransferase family 4 protein [Nitrospirota bacterium]
MKLTILHTEASNGWGGQEIRTFREAVGMRERGHKLIIAAGVESQLLYRSKKEGFKTIPVSFKRRYGISIILFLKKLIEKEKIDIVNTHSSKDSWLALPAARIAANKPLVMRTRHLSTKIHGGILNRFLYNYLPHYVLTTGEAIRMQMIEKNGFDGNKIKSIPTGVDTDIFSPDRSFSNIREELNLEPSVPVVGAVSVIRSWKGLDYLVKAAPLILKEIPDAKFLIAGDGPYRERLEKTIKQVRGKDTVYLLGHREDVASIINSIDILVHPSYANEGVPQTVLQAMAMKKPVIASGLPSLKEVVIDNKTGIIVPPKDPEGIARAVIKLLCDKELARELGESGMALAKTSYSFKLMLDKLENLYAGDIKGV